ncbi:MAG: lipocalin-like domain-containing protein [Bacteroidia bacterium]
MKKSLLLFVMLALGILSSLAQTKFDLLVGNWKLGDMTMPTPGDMPDSLVVQLKAVYKAQLDTMKKTASFDFNKDGTFLVKIMGQENKGTWAINSNASKMLMTTDNKTDTAFVSELNKLRFVFDVKSGEQKSTVTLVH